MRPNYKVEVASGFFLILGMGALLWLATAATDYGQKLGSETYTVTAHFTNVADLKLQAPVKVGGVVVGQVEDIRLDPATFEAVVTLKLDMRFNEIPTDTSASILTSGVLGDRYIGLEPGGSFEFLVDGDVIFLTQSAVILEQLISKFLFNTDKEDKQE